MTTNNEYTPTAIDKWTMPDSYGGEAWPDYYVAPCSRHRDSDTLSRANFDACLKELGGEQTADDDDDTPLVAVVREGHWAFGWIEWIAIHETAYAALKKADEIAVALENYPVVDELLWSEYENTEAGEVWRNCYSERGRIEYMRKFPSQFEFRDFADMRAQVRGEYFGGYASELLA